MVKNIIRNTAIALLTLAAACALSMIFQRLDVTEHITTAFVFAVFIISLLTEGYLYGILSAVIGMFAINFAFTYPFFSFDFITPINVISAVIMLAVAVITGMLTTKIKTYETAKLESERERMRANLLRAVSHDLRTPLTMIGGYVEMMRDIPGEATPENMQVIIDETQRLTSLVNELLDFSRLQTGALAFNPAPYPFTASVQAITDRVSRMVQQNGYQVVFHPAAQVKAIADEQRIAQVVYNLVGNALTYTGEDKTVEIHQEVIGKMVRLTIHDSGKGIAPEELPLIWNRYYRTQETHKRAIIGSGLGLSIVRSILEKHNVPFGVDSKEGEGTSFWFELPLAEG